MRNKKDDILRSFCYLRWPHGNDFHRRYPPQSLTWNLKMMVSKRNLRIFEGLIFRWTVLDFRGQFVKLLPQVVVVFSQARRRSDNRVYRSTEGRCALKVAWFAASIGLLLVRHVTYKWHLLEHIRTFVWLKCDWYCFSTTIFFDSNIFFHLLF